MSSIQTYAAISSSICYQLISLFLLFLVTIVAIIIIRAKREVVNFLLEDSDKFQERKNYSKQFYQERKAT